MKPPKIKIEDLLIGEFADVNGSIVYRYKPPISVGINPWAAMDYVWIIEKHNHKPLWGGVEQDTDKTNHYYGFPIKSPEKKHVDQTIGLLHNALKDKHIDNLTYVENLNILKNYNKCGIVVKD